MGGSPDRALKRDENRAELCMRAMARLNHSRSYILSCVQTRNELCLWEAATVYWLYWLIESFQVDRKIENQTRLMKIRLKQTSKTRQTKLHSARPSFSYYFLLSSSFPPLVTSGYWSHDSCDIQKVFPLQFYEINSFWYNWQNTSS